MLIRVFEIPEPTGNFHFSGGEPQTFYEVDWFQDPNSLIDREDGEQILQDFIQGKHYYNPDKAYLILSPKTTFTINYTGGRSHE